MNIKKIKFLAKHIFNFSDSKLEYYNQFPCQSLTQEASDPFKVKSVLLHKDKVKTIFDVGAHEGIITARYRELFTKAKIFAFEPYFPSFEGLTKNYATDALVSLHNLAISSNIGQHKLNVNSSILTNSLLETDIKGSSNWKEGLLETVETRTVDVITLDKFCLDNQISFIDLLKLDIQGNELSALRGAQQLLLDQCIDVIYCEIILVPTYQKQGLFSQVLDFAQNFNYQLFGIYNPCYKQLRLNQIDIILVSQKIYSSYANLLLE